MLIQKSATIAEKEAKIQELEKTEGQYKLKYPILYLIRSSRLHSAEVANNQLIEKQAVLTKSVDETTRVLQQAIKSNKSIMEENCRLTENSNILKEKIQMLENSLKQKSDLLEKHKSLAQTIQALSSDLQN